MKKIKSSTLKKLICCGVLFACIDQMFAPAGYPLGPRGPGDRGYRSQPRGPYELRGCDRCRWIADSFCCKCLRTQSGKRTSKFTCVSRHKVEQCEEGFTNIHGNLVCIDNLSEVDKQKPDEISKPPSKGGDDRPFKSPIR